MGTVSTPEPAITINGVRLTGAQAMTVRVALSAADWDCGDDQMGKQLSEGYKARAREVFAIMRCNHVWVPSGLGDVCEKCFIHSSQASDAGESK